MPSVVMLSWEYPPYVVGGLARHVYALARELSGQGYAVHVLTRAVSGSPSVSEEDGIQVIRVLPYFQEPPDFRLWVGHLNFALMEAGTRLLSSLNGSVLLHAHDWLVAYAARGLKHLFRLPMVATIHATEHGRQNGIHDQGQQYINDVEWWLTYEAWRVIVCSRAMQSEVIRLFGLSPDKVVVIPNGIDSKAAAGNVRRSDFAGPSERLIFHIGRLVPEKGANVLLEAVAQLRSRYPLRLVIGGVGPYREELERRAWQLGIHGMTTFAGWLDDAVAQMLFRLADVAVVPSTYEPFGIVALEAMAAGAPLVASDVGGLSEIVKHEENGLKAYPGQPRSLADQIDRMLSQPAWARRLAEVGQREALTRYSWQGIAKGTAAVYDEVLSSSASLGWGFPGMNPGALRLTT